MDNEQVPVPLRPTLLTSRFYYTQATRIWDLVLASLAIDLLLFISPLAGQHFEQPLQQLITISIIIVIPLLLFRERITNLLLLLGSNQKTFFSSQSRTTWGIAVVTLLAIFIQVILKFREVNTAALIAAGVMVLFAIRPILKALKERQEKQTQLNRDRTFWIEEHNKMLFVIALIPIVLTRILCISSLMLSQVQRQTIETQCLWWGLCIGLFLYTRPKLEEFTFHCKRCGNLTSKVLVRQEMCPICFEATYGSAGFVVK